MIQICRICGTCAGGLVDGLIPMVPWPERDLCLNCSQIEAIRKNASTYLAIRRERERQVSKGWTASHDDCHHLGELANAAAYYACEPYNRTDEIVSRVWPWDEPPKPNQDRKTELIKAGALIVAELERLSRLEK